MIVHNRTASVICFWIGEVLDDVFSKASQGHVIFRVRSVLFGRLETSQSPTQRERRNLEGCQAAFVFNLSTVYRVLKRSPESSLVPSPPFHLIPASSLYIPLSKWFSSLLPPPLPALSGSSRRVQTRASETTFTKG
jgi:hypothetical protein